MVYAERIIYTGFIHDLTNEKEAEARIREYALESEKLVEDRTATLRNMVQALEEAKEEVSLSLEKEKELSQLKSRFVSMAPHKFRTPLSSIQLSAKRIEKYATNFDNASITKHVNKINNSVGNLTGIFNGFLSLERLEAGKIELSSSHFNLVKPVEEIIEEMQVKAVKPNSDGRELLTRMYCAEEYLGIQYYFFAHAL